MNEHNPWKDADQDPPEKEIDPPDEKPEEPDHDSIGKSRELLHDLLPDAFLDMLRKKGL